jgi:hypothetical protein
LVLTDDVLVGSEGGSSSRKIVRGRFVAFWVCLFVLISVSCLYLVEHELAHAVIFEEAGCSYRFGATMTQLVTFGNCSMANLTSGESDALFVAQANVESFGYQILPMVILLIFIFCAVVYYGSVRK